MEKLTKTLSNLVVRVTSDVSVRDGSYSSIFRRIPKTYCRLAWSLSSIKTLRIFFPNLGCWWSFAKIAKKLCAFSSSSFLDHSPFLYRNYLCHVVTNVNTLPKKHFLDANDQGGEVLQNTIFIVYCYSNEDKVWFLRQCIGHHDSRSCWGSGGAESRLFRPFTYFSENVLDIQTHRQQRAKAIKKLNFVKFLSKHRFLQLLD